MFLLILNVFLLAVGCVMDMFSAILVVAPLVLPLGAAFGINPVHMGIIFVANLHPTKAVHTITAQEASRVLGR